MNYAQTLDYLFSQLPMFHRIGAAAYKPGLDNIYALCAAIGNPQQQLKYVHIAGTNGKGSTSHLIASVLQEAGYKTGLYTSPHLIDFRERIKVNGAMIPEKDVVEFVEQHKAHIAHLQPSFFEWTMMLAFDHFEKTNCDIVVLETGLGGRLDSTNIITPEVSVITNIGLDHMHLLGDSIASIAREKAGIIKQEIPVVIGHMLPEAAHIMRSTAQSQHATIFLADDVEAVPATPLLGDYQKENTRTAFSALRVLQQRGWNIAPTHIQKGFADVVKNTDIMGRWQMLQEVPLVIADVAHNEDGIRAVVKQLSETPHDALHFVLGMVNDKDIAKVLALLPKHATYYFCKANIPRGLEANVLKQQATECGLKGEVYTSVASAFSAAKQAATTSDVVFIGGSFFTVAEVL